jgi:hypothetical protein
MKSHPDRSPLSAFELAFQQFVYLLRVGLALGSRTTNIKRELYINHPTDAKRLRPAKLPSKA